MKNFIDVKVRWNKTMSDGLVKRVSENYLIDAMSFTEAEERALKEFVDYDNVEAEITAVHKSNIAELVKWDYSEKWYKAKIVLTSLDEKSGTEKRTAYYILVQAESFQKAVKRIEEHMKGSVSDYQIASVSESNIIDVFEHNDTTDGTL